MRGLPQRLLSLCLTGALLLPLCWGDDTEDNYGYVTTPDYDYNATFEYDYYSNTSSLNYEMYEILKERKTIQSASPEDGTRSKSQETILPTLLVIFSLSIHQLYQLL